MTTKNDTIIFNGDDAEEGAQINDIKVVDLKRELKQRKLRTTGNDIALITRFKAALALEKEHGDDGASSADSSNEDETEEPTQKSRRTMLTFNDVESSLVPFSGDDIRSVHRWIHEFEETASMCEWSDVQKIVYAKRLLRGSAKLFVRYEKCSKTWRNLKDSLQEEFAHVSDSRAIHRELSNRKKNSGESFQEYVYKMLEIAAQASVETRSVIKYIIGGIQDEPRNKAVLYGAKTIRDLKEKLNQYEAMKNEAKTGRNYKQKEKKTTTKEDRNSAIKRCFNCGNKDHLNKECPSKSRGNKALFGYLSSSFL